jgi:hypothetical protein
MEPNGKRAKSAKRSKGKKDVLFALLELSNFFALVLRSAECGRLGEPSLL